MLQSAADTTNLKKGQTQANTVCAKIHILDQM